MSKPSLIDLPNEELLLRLSIFEDELEDPAAWCEAFRQLRRDSQKAPKTSDEAHRLMDRAAALLDAIHPKSPPPSNLSPEEEVEAMWKIFPGGSPGIK